ncbi:MAG TPA: phosphomannomutase, partial [Myxococcales bacterium]|nr:phosphomannomutase [Myxococcales bacterium]
MSIPEHVFREYDVRGLTASELTASFAESLGRGFGRYLLERNPAAQAVVLGRDHRTSSPQLARGFSAGVREQGIDVVVIGTVPTPLTYFAANTLPVDGLCMITGSHNPPEYNGFKAGIGKSTFAGPEVQELKQHVLDAGPGGKSAREVEHDSITP